MYYHTVLFRPVGLMPCNARIDADVTHSAVLHWIRLMHSLQPILQEQMGHQKCGYLYALQMRYQPNRNFRLRCVCDHKGDPVQLSVSFQMALVVELSKVTDGEPVLYLELHDRDKVYRAGVLYSTLCKLVEGMEK